MLVLQDWLLFIGHVLLVVFNMVGWIWKRTRKLHLITIGLTAFSWIVLGAVYGWGYCFFTDYHAEVLEQLGHPDAHKTFIQLMFKRLLGLSLGLSTANMLAVIVFIMIILATAFVWIRDWQRGRSS